MHKGYRFLFGNITLDLLQCCIVIFALISVCTLSFLCLKTHVWIKSAIGIMVIISCLIVGSKYSFENWSDIGRYTYITPDTKSQVVIEEINFLHAGGVYCYIRDNMFFVKRLNGAILTEGTNQGGINFEWIDNESFSLKYHGATIFVNIKEYLSSKENLTNIKQTK